MEFFEFIEQKNLDEDKLKAILVVDALPGFCDSVYEVISNEGDVAEINCVWGVFSVKRDVIYHGVRFSLLNCPHAFSWTITFDKQRGRVIIHCTIDKQEQDEDFLESIKQFTADWKSGLSRVFS